MLLSPKAWTKVVETNECCWPPRIVDGIKLWRMKVVGNLVWGGNLRVRNKRNKKKFVGFGRNKWSNVDRGYLNSKFLNNQNYVGQEQVMPDENEKFVEANWTRMRFEGILVNLQVIDIIKRWLLIRIWIVGYNSFGPPNGDQ